VPDQRHVLGVTAVLRADLPRDADRARDVLERDIAGAGIRVRLTPVRDEGDDAAVGEGCRGVPQVVDGVGLVRAAAEQDGDGMGARPRRWGGDVELELADRVLPLGIGEAIDRQKDAQGSLAVTCDTCRERERDGREWS